MGAGHAAVQPLMDDNLLAHQVENAALAKETPQRPDNDKNCTRAVTERPDTPFCSAPRVTYPPFDCLAHATDYTDRKRRLDMVCNFGTIEGLYTAKSRRRSTCPQL